MRNGEALSRGHLDHSPCDEAVCLDGTVVLHPPGLACLARILIEVWKDEVYTGRFYRPRPGDTVIDAGSNIGLLSLLLARRRPCSRRSGTPGGALGRGRVVC